MFAQTLDGQPIISAGIGSSQQRAYGTLAQSLNLGATGPGVYTDGEPLVCSCFLFCFDFPFRSRLFVQLLREKADPLLAKVRDLFHITVCSEETVVS